MKLGLVRDAEDLVQAVIELPEKLGGLDGEPPQEGIEGLRVKDRLQGQCLPDETVIASVKGWRQTEKGVG